MTALALALAGAALIGVVILAFGYSALLRIIDELQRAISTGGGIARDPVPALAGGRVSVAIVVDSGCRSCADRLDELAKRLGSEPSDLIDFHVIGAFDGADIPTRVRAHRDPALTGTLAVTVRPCGLVFDGEGRELRRSVLGDPRALEDLIVWAEEQSSQHTILHTDRFSA